MRILVIKLGAFGDICLSLGLFEHIRARHPQAQITLLTTPPFAELCRRNPAFDHVETIERWHVLQPAAWLGYHKRMQENSFDLVYDLQSNDRTRWLRWLSPKQMRGNWVDVRKALAPHNTDALDVSKLGLPLPQKMDWLASDITDFNLPERFVLLVPGSAPQHPGKRWPVSHYAALAQKISAAGCLPVMIGTQSETDVIDSIKAACPEALSLAGQTSFHDIAALAQRAVAAVGNDTGPMHLISICGCPVVSLFSHLSDPAQSAPRGPRVRVLRHQNMADISVDDVFNLLSLG